MGGRRVAPTLIWSNVQCMIMNLEDLEGEMRQIGIEKELKVTESFFVAPSSGAHHPQPKDKAEALLRTNDFRKTRKKNDTERTYDDFAVESGHWIHRV